MPRRKPHPSFGESPLATPMRPMEQYPGTEWSIEYARRIKLVHIHYGLVDKTGNVTLRLKPLPLEGYVEKRPSPEDYWRELAFRLMFDLVPGLRDATPAKGGRKSFGEKGRLEREDLNRIADQILAKKRRESGDDKLELPITVLARLIKHQLSRQSAPHFFKGRSERTIRRHLARARREFLARGAAPEVVCCEPEKPELAKN